MKNDDSAEVLSINGSIARSDDDVKIHAHVSLGRRYGAAIGGHLMSAIVFPILELFVIDHGTPLARHLDHKTGLWLLDLG